LNGKSLLNMTPPPGWNRERKYIGLTGIALDSIHRDQVFAHIFLHLLCKDFQKLKERMNDAVSIKNISIGQKKGRIPKFSDSEIITGFTIIIGAGATNGNICMMWKSERQRRETTMNMRYKRRISKNLA
jgi:hypothetical protein